MCGYAMTETSGSERCPVCGGPKKQFEAFES
ncbi:rubredoxin-like domain-containing protein [Lachnospiraceae bacterium 29-91]